MRYATVVVAFSSFVAFAVGPVLLVTPVDAASSAGPIAVTGCPAITPGVLQNAPHVAGGHRTVALTFDDGPGPSTTAIMAILNSFHVRATFFNIDSQMVQWTTVVRREVAEGFLLGDHSANHPYMPGLSASQQYYQVRETVNEQWALTHTTPCVFRPPYGSYNAATRSAAFAQHQSFWQWNDGGGDWKARGSGSAYWISYIERAVLNVGLSESHPVVLLHNQAISMPATVAALPTIIRTFLNHGYRFVDLLGRSGPPNSCGSPNAPTPSSPARTLPSGGSLASGASVTSPSGQYQLTMDANGNLVLAVSAGRTIWESGTGGHFGATAKVNVNGTLSIISITSHVLWTSTGVSHAGAYLAVHNSGNLDLLSGSTQYWSANSSQSVLYSGDRLRSGWSLTSPNGRCQLTATGSGPLRLGAADGQTLWRSDARTTSGAVTVLQHDGNVVTRGAGGQSAWDSATSAQVGDRLIVTNTGVVELISARGVKIWATQ